MDQARQRVDFVNERNCGVQVGDSHGVINNNVYFHPGTSSHRALGKKFFLPVLTVQSSAESKPKKLVPYNTVPYRRDPDYVERGILEDVFNQGLLPASRVALVGLGGVGYVMHGYNLQNISLTIPASHNLPSSTPIVSMQADHRFGSSGFMPVPWSDSKMAIET